MGERVPAEVWPPAQFILEEMEHRGWAMNDLARYSGLSAAEVVLLTMHGEPVTLEVAQGLGRAFNTSPMLWLRLQVAWDTSLAHELGPGELVESASDRQAGEE